tara:strand:+ start:554 stop:880 length:327 start_codon:yes stop_codon:yes gene_type:complete
MSKYIIHCKITDQALVKYTKTNRMIRAEWKYFDYLDNGNRESDILMSNDIDESAIFDNIREAQETLKILADTYTKNGEKENFTLLEVTEKVLHYYTVQEHRQWASQVL